MTAEDLARAVKARRAELALTQGSMAQRGGPSTETLRLIENCTHSDSPSERTLAKIDVALYWWIGSSARLLAEGKPPVVELPEDRIYKLGDEASGWARLADAVRERRKQKRLPMDLSTHEGPSEITVRKIERGEPISIAPRTMTQLERALAWRHGSVDRILAGAVSVEDLNAESDAAMSADDERALRVGRAILVLLAEIGAQ